TPLGIFRSSVSLFSFRIIRCRQRSDLLRGKLFRLAEKHVLYLAFAYPPDRAAPDEKQRVAVAAGAAEIGARRLARSVHYTAHQRDVDRPVRPYPGKLFLKRARLFYQIDPAPTAGRAGYQIHAAAYADRAKHIPRGLDLRGDIRRKRHAHRISYTVGKQRADAYRALDRAAAQRAR